MTRERRRGHDAVWLPDADVEKVAEQLFWSSFSNAGQVCIAAKRIYLHRCPFVLFRPIAKLGSCFLTHASCICMHWIEVSKAI